MRSAFLKFTRILERITSALERVEMAKQVVCATDEDGYEAIYVDSELVDDDYTIHAIDIAKACGDSEVTIKHINVLNDGIEKWPESLSQLVLTAGSIREAMPLNIEEVRWISVEEELPDAGMEILICYQRKDSEHPEDREVTIGYYDDDCDEGESPWEVDGGLMQFGKVLYWAETLIGPKAG